MEKNWLLTNCFTIQGIKKEVEMNHFWGRDKSHGLCQLQPLFTLFPQSSSHYILSKWYLWSITLFPLALNLRTCNSTLTSKNAISPELNILLGNSMQAIWETETSNKLLYDKRLWRETKTHLMKCVVHWIGLFDA